MPLRTKKVAIPTHISLNSLCNDRELGHVLQQQSIESISLRAKKLLILKDRCLTHVCNSTGETGEPYNLISPSDPKRCC